MFPFRNSPSSPLQIGRKPTITHSNLQNLRYSEFTAIGGNSSRKAGTVEGKSRVELSALLSERHCGTDSPVACHDANEETFWGWGYCSYMSVSPVKEFKLGPKDARFQIRTITIAVILTAAVEGCSYGLT